MLATNGNWQRPEHSVSPGGLVMSGQRHEQPRATPIEIEIREVSIGLLKKWSVKPSAEVISRCLHLGKVGGETISPSATPIDSNCPMDRKYLAME